MIGPGVARAGDFGQRNRRVGRERAGLGAEKGPAAGTHPRQVRSGCMGGATDNRMNFAATSDDSRHDREFRQGDTVRCLSDGDECRVIGTRDDWLWLDPIDYRDAAPFTGRAVDYELIRRE